jgi:hypothetical protein
MIWRKIWLPRSLLALEAGSVILGAFATWFL